MTVAILGPGAVGGVLAVGLANAGVRVICIARPDTAAVIRSEGLSLRRGQEVVAARPDVAEALEEPVDLTFVTVKAPSLDDALRRIHAPAGTVLPLLNGIEHMQTIRERLADANVVGASIGRIEAFLERPAVVVQPTPSVVMTVAQEADEATVELVRSSGTDVRINGSEAAVLWEKLARQAPTAAATSITQRPIGELRDDSGWRPRIQQAIAEACSVAAADGVSLSAEAEWEIIEAMPPLLTSSTARDIALGRPSELDAITGAAVRAGRRAGIPIPALEQLLAEAEDVCRALSH
jgi:2-dehydropantoate 2-reductase